MIQSISMSSILYKIHVENASTPKSNEAVTLSLDFATASVSV
ncbi:hypothetical protein [Porphyromonas macacae]|nr:hypothetical protein [Porphyromonas macacae]